MPSAAYFRRQADICLRLSLIASDENVSNRLITMAREYMATSDALDREKGGPSLHRGQPERLARGRCGRHPAGFVRPARCVGLERGILTSRTDQANSQCVGSPRALASGGVVDRLARDARISCRRSRSASRVALAPGRNGSAAAEMSTASGVRQIYGRCSFSRRRRKPCRKGCGTSLIAWAERGCYGALAFLMITAGVVART